MSNYDAISARALATISKKGGAVTFHETGTASTYSASTDTWSGAVPASDVVGRAIQLEDDPKRRAARSLVLTNPLTLLVAASGLSITPMVGKTMTWNSVVYAIRDVEVLAPNGTTPILFTIVGSVG